MATPEAKPSTESRRTQYEKLRAALDQERSPFIVDWTDINDYILPGRGRFYTTETNRRRDRKRIIDSTGQLAANTLSAGFMAHMTSPSREWKELTIPDDPDLAKWGPVKEWLYNLNGDMSDIHRSCGLYKTFPTFYLDFGGFGTSAFFAEEDMTGGRVLRTHPFAPGSYWVANDENGRVCVFMRAFTMTVRQIVAKFARKGADGSIDWSNISTTVQSAYMAGNYESKIEVVHIVHPNPDYNPLLLLSRYKKYLSCYYESGTVRNSSQGNYMAGKNDDLFLSEKGYDFFPVLVGRWAVTDGDSYATDCPGMMALGDVKSLQTREKMIARGEEKGINPAMIAGPALKTTKASTLPGDITYDPNPVDKGFRKAHDMEFHLEFSEQKQEAVRSRINEAFYKNLFLSVTMDKRNERGTAYEWSLRKQEEFAVLGPVVEGISSDVLDPLVDITFALMLQQRRVPPPPQELMGKKLGVRYISSMAQAQKATGLGGVERFLSIAGAIGTQIRDPAFVTDKVDIDMTLDYVGEMTGAPAGMVRDEKRTQERRDARMQAQAAAQQVEQAKAEAQAAQSLAQAKTEEPNALSGLMSAARAAQEQ